MLIPSIFFAYSLYEQQKFTQSVNEFINKEFTLEGNTVIYKRTSYSSTPKTIELAFLSKVPESTIDSAENKMIDYGLPDTKLYVMQDSSDNIQKLKSDILNEVKVSEFKVNEKDAKIKLLEEKIAKNTYDNEQILKEVNSIYPDINSISVSNHTFYTENDSTENVIPVMIYNSDKALKTDDQQKLKNWLKLRLDKDSVEIYKEN
ncbi:MAG: hypothetical protein R2942_08885 [Ignavibacteria bacterium]